jgi:hypothetical protein
LSFTAARATIGEKAFGPTAPGYSFDIEATRGDSLWAFTDLRIYDSYQV